MKNHPYFLGIVYSIAGFTIWVFVDTIMKFTAEAHIPPYEISGFLGLVTALFIALRAIGTGNLQSLRPQNKTNQISLALTAVGCGICAPIGLKHLPLTSFYAIIFTSPLIIALLANVFLKEPLGRRNFLLILAGFVGAFIAIDPMATRGNGDWIGYAATFLQALFYSTNVIISRRLTQSESIESLVLFNGSANALIGFGVAFASHTVVALNIQHTGLLVTAGLLNMVAIAMAYLSVKHAPASIAAPFHYSQIISGAIIGYLIWGDVPTSHLVIGVSIIILSGLHFVMRTGKAEA